MFDISYDLNKLAEFDEFDEMGVKKNIGAEKIYFGMLTDFANKSSGYLSSYNPTVVIYGEDVRNQFVNEMNFVKKLLLALGVKESETGIDSLEEAIKSSSEKGLSDGLLKFSARAQIIAEHIRQSQVSAGGGQADAVQAEAPQVNKPVVFAVDDSIVSLNIIKNILSEFFTPITVTSGDEAIIALQKYVPDLFLIDIEMPEITGHQLVAIIRKYEHLREKPILFVTSSASREHVYAAKKLGVSDYILKPFEKEALINKINMYLQK